MRQRTIAISALIAMAIAVGLLGVRQGWFAADGGSDGEERTTGPSLLESGETTGISSMDADSRATLAARGSSEGGAAGDLLAPVEFERVDRDLDLHGTVVDGNGKPVAGASLTTVTYPFDRASILAVDRDEEALAGPRTRSAKDGSFAIRLRRGAIVSLRVEAPDLAPVERPSCHAGERVTVVLRPGVALVVEATEPGGGPAAGVAFALVRHGHSGTTAFRRRATTGADGRAKFVDLPPGATASLEVEAAAWLWREWDRSVLLPESGEETTRVEFAAGRTLSGRVTDAETQSPIGGARVGMNWTLNRSVRTDADGRYSLPGWGYEGIRDIHVLADGYGRGQRVVGTASVVDFALSKGDSAVGRVVGPDDRPVVGAVVAAVGSVRRDREQVTSMADGTTDADGRFSLSGLRRDMPHTLIVMPTGFGRTLVDFDPHEGGPGAIDLGDVRVRAGRVVSGRVLSHEGAPVAVATVELKGANADRGKRREGGKPVEDAWYGSTEEGTVDNAGRFSFADLAPGTYEIEAWTQGMPSQHATVVVGDDADPAPVELRFPPGRRVRVVVVDDAGVPVPWAYVIVSGRAGPYNTVTSLDTDATLSLLLPESTTAVQVSLWGRPAGEERRFIAENAEFPLDPKATELRCVLERGVVLRGHVVGPDGAALAHVGIEVLVESEVISFDWTDDAGEFDVTAPRGKPLLVRLDGSAGDWNSSKDAGLAGEVVVLETAATGIVVRAHAAARDRRQEVLVVNADGEPVKGALVDAQWARGSGAAGGVETDARGRAEIAGLPECPCAFKATPPASATEYLQTSGDRAIPDRGVVTIKLRRGLRVRGRVVLPTAAAGMAVRVEIAQEERRTVTQVSPGQTTFSALLDPEFGETGSMDARAGPDGAPSFVARVENVRFGEGEVVLTLDPVK